MLSNLSVVWISLSVGTLVKVAGYESRMEANRMGRAAFFEPLICTCPVRGTPPSITSVSIGSLLYKNDTVETPLPIPCSLEKL
jgi:hypothetical protein